jgi:hypothetical protein
VDHDDLLRGVEHVQYEWTQMAGCAARLELVDGIRTPDENATLEALLLHARCLINFLCGNYRGGWMREDMKPADFLRAPWVLPDDEMDRRLRGRLTVINQSLAHLSWRRVSDAQGVMWPTGLLAHEVHWAMHQFVEALPANDPALMRLWGVAAAEADRWMPPRRDNWAELRGFEPAPPRVGNPPEPVALDDE